MSESTRENMSNEELESTVKAFVAARTAEKRNKELKETAADLIKRELENLGVEHLYVGDYSVYWKYYTRNSFNMQRFKQENPLMYQSYITPSRIKMFTVE